MAMYHHPLLHWLVHTLFSVHQSEDVLQEHICLCSLSKSQLWVLAESQAVIKLLRMFASPNDHMLWAFCIQHLNFQGSTIQTLDEPHIVMLR